MAWTDWLGPLRPRHFTIRTRRSVDTSRHALANAIGSRWNPFSRKDAVGYVRDDTALLRRQNLFFHNSFRPEMHVRFEADGRGAVLRCVTRLNVSTIVFMSFWFGFVLLFQFGILFAGGFQGVPPIVDFTPILMICMGLFLVFFGAFLGAGEPEFLANFVAAKVEGAATEDPER